MDRPVRNYARASRQSGMSLIELMVAMILGIFLMLGAVTVFNQSRSTYRAAEGLARLQEVGRLAMDVVESDLRMANFWGMNADATFIVNRAGSGDPLPSAFTAAQGAILSSCGGNNSNWAIDLDNYLGGSNNDGNLGSVAPFAPGFAIVAGHSGSTDFPTTPGAFSSAGPATPHRTVSLEITFARSRSEPW